MFSWVGEANDNAAGLPPTDTWAPPSVVGHGVVVAWTVLVERFCPYISAKVPGDNDAVNDAPFSIPLAPIVGTCAKTAASNSTATSVTSKTFGSFNMSSPPLMVVHLPPPAPGPWHPAPAAHRQRLIGGIHGETKIPGDGARHLRDAHRVVHMAAGATGHGDQQRDVQIAAVDAAVVRTNARVAEVVAGQGRQDQASRAGRIFRRAHPNGGHRGPEPGIPNQRRRQARKVHQAGLVEVDVRHAAVFRDRRAGRKRGLQVGLEEWVFGAGNEAGAAMV